MKSNFTYFSIAMAAIAALSMPVSAYAGSIQVLPPSTSKIEVIGNKKHTSNKNPDITKPEEPKAAKIEKPKIKAKSTMAKVLPTMPKMRTGEIELPIIPVNQVKSN